MGIKPCLWQALVALTLAFGVLLMAGCSRGTPTSPATVPLHQVFEEIDHVHGLAADPFEPELLWASSHNALLQYTPARGWQVVSGARFDLMGFTIHPREQGVLYSSGHPGIREGKVYPDQNPLGLQVSRNGGQTWKSISLVGKTDFHILSVSPADPSLMYGYDILAQVLRRSRDSGQSWEALAEGVRLRFFGEGHGIAPHPTLKQRLLAAAQNGLWLSQDSGLSWSPVKGELAETPVASVAYHLGDPQIVVAYAPLKKGLLRSDDGGQTWTPLDFLLPGRELVLYIATHPQDPNQLYIATTGADVLHSGDGGKTWEYLMRGGRAVSQR